MLNMQGLIITEVHGACVSGPHVLGCPEMHFVQSLKIQINANFDLYFIEKMNISHLCNLNYLGVLH